MSKSIYGSIPGSTFYHKKLELNKNPKIQNMPRLLLVNFQRWFWICEELAHMFENLCKFTIINQMLTELLNLID